jgi:Protein of unknown function (DUF1045)
VVAAVDRFARRHAPVPIGLLEAAPVGGYVALVPVQPDPGIATLAAACLKDFDRFSAPLTPAEQERHKATGLTERQVQLLQRWGYPYVLDQFRFHMRLAGPLSARELELFTALLSNSFASLAGDHFEVDAISLMRQDDVDKRFFVVARQRLTGP